MEYKVARWKVVTPPAAEPVSVAELETHLRLGDSGEDTYLGVLIGAARRQCERFTQRAFVDTVFTEYLEDFPHLEHYLYWGNVTSVSAVQYVAEGSETLTTLASTYYDTDLNDSPALIRLADGATWPDVEDVPDGVRITYTAGFGASGDVPDDIRVAIMMVAADMYERRADSVKQLPTASQMLLTPYRLWHV